MANQKKRIPVDAWIWSAFVAACGNRCASCGAVGVPLERGHRISHATNGPEAYDNLIPVCKTCNKRYLKKETPDTYRPEDYLEQFFLRLGYSLRPQISVNTANGLSRLIPGTEVAENTRVISWVDPQNSLRTEVFTQSQDTLTRHEAETLVGQLIYKSRRAEPRPHLPFPVHKTELICQAMRSRSKFVIATKAYLRDEAWKMPGSEMQVLIDCWGPLANNFGHYLRLGYEYLAAQAKAVERQRLEAIETEKRLKVEGLRTKLLTGLMSVNSDWLADEANWTRCDDLRKRVRAAATPEQLDGLTDEASALVLDVQKWREELPSVVDGDF